MALTAADVMQTHLIKVSPADPLDSVKRLFYEEEIQGAPVVDDEGRVLGMITSMDLIRAAMDASDDGGTDFGIMLEDLRIQWDESADGTSSRLSEATVEDVMTRDAVWVEPETSVSEIARVLRENRIHRVLVVKKDALMGIVSSFDLIQVLEQAVETEKPAHA
jgi:CBS domain-containing protein